MKICAINSAKYMAQKQNIYQKPQMNHEVQDSMSFCGKANQESLIGANYSDMLEGLNLSRERTIFQLREAIQNGEDISQDREKLILSRLPKAIRDAEKFCRKNPQFNIEDVEQDLIHIVIRATDGELNSNSQNYKYNPNYEMMKSRHFEKMFKNERKAKAIEEHLSVKREELAINNPYVQLKRCEENEDLKRIFGEAIKNLTPLRQEVIKMRFGLDGCEKMTLDEIGEKFSSSKQNIKQLEMRALKDLEKACSDIYLKKDTGESDED